jgi:hypothetical protein
VSAIEQPRIGRRRKKGYGRISTIFTKVVSRRKFFPTLRIRLSGELEGFEE